MSDHARAYRSPGSQRTTRWGPENAASELNGLSTTITAARTSEQIEAYVLHFRIEEITQSLRTDNIDRSTSRVRSPSPRPEYDTSGRRMNTRERRYRQRLEDERQKLVDTALKTIDGYRPPSDFRHSRYDSTTKKKKVFIPVGEFPSVNFIGHILGPRGQSLREMSAKSDANIVIRGKGSVKQGSSRSHRITDDMQEPLQCLITADSRHKVKKARELIDQVIEDVISIPEDQNARKSDQLRQLAQLNGTLRDDEHQTCHNCGQHGHRQYTCLEPDRLAANVVCRICQNAGHLARDCPDGKKTRKIPPWSMKRVAQVLIHMTEPDPKFEQLMMELT